MPEQHTDFIFTVAGEEFGFVGAMVVLLLFALLLWRAIRIAYLSKDPFGTLRGGRDRIDVRDPDVRERRDGDRDHADHRDPVAVPVSYGGSAILTNFIAIGMLESIHMRRFI